MEDAEREAHEVVERARLLQELVDAPGFQSLIAIVREALQRSWIAFLEEKDHAKIVDAAYEGRATFGILREIDESLRDARDLGFELAERARQEEAHRESIQRAKEQAAWHGEARRTLGL